MAYHSGPLNNQKPATFALGFWNLVQAWLLANWVIKASGDGLSAYSATGSVFTNGGATGANGFNNTGAWLRIAMPGTMSGREFCIVYGGGGIYSIAISPAAKFITGGSATVAASAADQQFILGTSLNSAFGSTLQAGNLGQNYYNAMADDAAPYTFYLFGFPQGNGEENCLFMSDYLSGVSTGLSTDPDPYTYIATSSFNQVTSVAGHCFGNGTWGPINVAAMGLNVASTNTNPFSGGYDLKPAITIFNSSWIKGDTTVLLFRFQSTGESSSLHRLFDSTGDRVAIGMYWALPWDGSAMVTA